MNNTSIGILPETVTSRDDFGFPGRMGRVAQWYAHAVVTGKEMNDSVSLSLKRTDEGDQVRLIGGRERVEVGDDLRGFATVPGDSRWDVFG